MQVSECSGLEGLVSSLSLSQRREENGIRKAANSIKQSIQEVAASRQGPDTAADASTGTQDPAGDADWLSSVSSDMSLISIKEDDALDGRTPPLPSLSKMPPLPPRGFMGLSPKTWAKCILSSPDNVSVPVSKRKHTLCMMAGEVSVRPGESLQLSGFHDELYNLSDHNIYMLITVFTLKSLRKFMKEGSSMKKVKLDNKRYHSELFEFNPAFYHLKYLEVCMNIRLRLGDNSRMEGDSKVVEANVLLLQTKSFLNSLQSKFAQGSSSDRSHGGFAGQGHGLGTPFQPDNRGGPSVPICLVCAQKGHMVLDCSFNRFADNSQIFAEGCNSSLFARGCDNEICWCWNMLGDTAYCTHSGRDRRQHICSFCSHSGHHTFKFVCRANPNK
ncbi:hypothetical protein OE88DRAFT_1647543 [Heliocybe sulcata]|uniref:Uncharacterized protein n=1 Tax=Heliocybe sulcata TaxID=5364 RepID=A0A5C3MS35_9AGAM|nr:hypothetical protein OE88DRAFT_1647543 [Heliocybe sulcata]